MFYFHKYKFSTKRLKRTLNYTINTHTYTQTHRDKCKLYVLNAMGLGRVQQFLLDLKIRKCCTARVRKILKYQYYKKYIAYKCCVYAC